MKKAGVEMISSVTYGHLDESGLHIAAAGQERVLAVDTVVVCAGQISERPLLDELKAAGISTVVVGGAKDAKGIDAQRAISEGTSAGMTVP
jgi:2,4-dienoyl-CoA reductase (NADPH2)